MHQVKIIMDNRERNEEILSCLKSKGVLIEYGQMPVGDYALSERVCIERKTESDLQNSVINSRLFDQLERLRQSFEKPMLVIEHDSAGFNLGANVMLGLVASLYLDYGIQVIHSKGPADTADIICAIASREQRANVNEPRLVGIKRAYSDYQWQILVLRSIPGVGEKLARDMLKRFKSIRAIANANVKDLSEIEKIGKKKAQRIWEVLNKEINNGV